MKIRTKSDREMGERGLVRKKEGGDFKMMLRFYDLNLGLRQSLQTTF